MSINIKEKDFLDKLNDMNNRVQQFQKSFAGRTPKYLPSKQQREMKQQIKEQIDKLQRLQKKRQDQQEQGQKDVEKRNSPPSRSRSSQESSVSSNKEALQDALMFMNRIKMQRSFRNLPELMSPSRLSVATSGSRSPTGVQSIKSIPKLS